MSYVRAEIIATVGDVIVMRLRLDRGYGETCDDDDDDDDGSADTRMADGFVLNPAKKLSANAGGIGLHFVTPGQHMEKTAIHGMIRERASIDVNPHKGARRRPMRTALEIILATNKRA